MQHFFGDTGPCSEGVRALLLPEEVDFGKTPKWVLDVAKVLVKQGQLPKPPRPLLARDEGLYHALASTGDSWADHTGRLLWDGYELLVAEPYAERMNESLMTELGRFVRLFRTDFLVSSNGSHFPGRTLRIIVAENSTILNEYRKHDYSRSMSIARAGVASGEPRPLTIRKRRVSLPR